MTDCKTHYITKVVNVMKEHQVRMLNEYLDYGTVTNDFSDDEFFSY